jgi:DNA uptake protein ComE-like DNA-binding protein
VLARAQRGQALVLAIIALTLLTAAAIALSTTARLELRAARRGVDQVRRDAALHGAVNAAIAQIEGSRRDPERLLALLREHRELQWQPAGGAPDAQPTAEAETPLMAAIQIVDACSRLDVNTATEDQLRRLPGVDRKTAAAIVAWRDGESRESDREYQSSPRPYAAKRRPFDTVEELLLVIGTDEATFFGAPTTAAAQALRDPPLCELLAAFSGDNNARPDGTSRADVNDASASALLSAANADGRLLDPTAVDQFVLQREQANLTGPQAGLRPYRSVFDALTTAQVAAHHWGPLLDAWTSDSRAFLPGRVNVNTAPAMVLQSVPGLTAEMVQTILRRRLERPEGLAWPDVLDVVGNTNPGSQPNSPPSGAPQPQPGEQQQQPGEQQQNRPAVDIERYLCVRSAVYLVRALVREGASRRVEAAQAVVYLPADPGEPARIVQWRRPERFPGWTAWYRLPEDQEGMNRGR